MFARLTLAAPVAALFLTSLATVPAEAGTVNQETIQVSYRDLDLLSDAGKAALMRRVVHAAELVCGPVDPRDLPGLDRVHACRAAAIAVAMPTVDAVVAAAETNPRYAMIEVPHPTLR